MLKERGYIYGSKHDGWYSVSDETFYPNNAIQLALDPSTGRKFMVYLQLLRARIGNFAKLLKGFGRDRY